MLCPRCQSDLRETIYEGVIVDTCDKCEGEWLDKDEILLINKVREVMFSEQERAEVKGAHGVVTTELKQPEKPLICPRCNVPLKVLNYAYSTGIIVDRCIKCDGLWLDKDELENIQIVIEEWDKITPELEAKFIPVLAQMKEEYDEKREKRIDEIIAKRKKIKRVAKSPMLNAMVKAILYRFL